MSMELQTKKAQSPVPATENSPAIHRWVPRPRIPQVPHGRLDAFATHHGGAASFLFSVARPHKPIRSFFASVSIDWSRVRCTDAFSPVGRLGRTPLGWA